MGEEGKEGILIASFAGRKSFRCLLRVLT
jgi:hypothetical protein